MERGNHRFLSAHLDFFGFTASLACALHCAALPAILTFGSIGGLGFLDHPLIEGAILLLGAIIALFSLLPAYKKHHKTIPLLIILAGFILILAGKFYEQSLYEALFTAVGASLVALAHYINWKLVKRTRPHHAMPKA